MSLPYIHCVTAEEAYEASLKVLAEGMCPVVKRTEMGTFDVRIVRPSQLAAWFCDGAQ